MTTLIYNARIAGGQKADNWLIFEDSKIILTGSGGKPKLAVDKEVDADGALMLPGVIDCHVHFREPGLTAKADMDTESRAALAGGVTSIMDMPNTKPATTSIEAWQQKCDIAEQKCLCNYAFFIGATNDNVEELKKADYRRVPGVKLFMGSSTGNMLVDSERALSEIFRSVDAVIAVHAEDQSIIAANTEAARKRYGSSPVPVSEHTSIRSTEACYRSAALAVELAQKYYRRLHLCHVTTARELELLQGGSVAFKLVTAEVSPHHLLWCSDDYAQKGTRIKMNPSVKSAADRDALRQALISGLIGNVATDHAPHLLSDKEGDALTAASGAPLVQFSLVAMLSLFDEQLVQKTMCENPAATYRIADRGSLEPGNYADIVLVREVEPYQITDSQVVSRCGWTPLDGVTVRHRVEKTWVNGQLAYDQGKFSDKSSSMPLRFK